MIKKEISEMKKIRCLIMEEVGLLNRRSVIQGATSQTFNIYFVKLKIILEAKKPKNNRSVLPKIILSIL